MYKQTGPQINWKQVFQTMAIVAGVIDFTVKVMGFADVVKHRKGVRSKKKRGMGFR